MSENNERYLIPDERKGDIQNGLRKMCAVAAHIDDLLNFLYRAHCEYRIMNSDFLENLSFPELTCDNRGNRLMKGDAYMIVTAPNGYPYYINVTADSPLTACAEVFQFIQHKL